MKTYTINFWDCQLKPTAKTHGLVGIMFDVSGYYWVRNWEETKLIRLTDTQQQQSNN